jgi:hypothetical protein
MQIDGVHSPSRLLMSCRPQAWPHSAGDLAGDHDDQHHHLCGTPRRLPASPRSSCSFPAGSCRAVHHPEWDHQTPGQWTDRLATDSNASDRADSGKAATNKGQCRAGGSGGGGENGGGWARPPVLQIACWFFRQHGCWDTEQQPGYIGLVLKGSTSYGKPVLKRSTCEKPCSQPSPHWRVEPLRDLAPCSHCAHTSALTPWSHMLSHQGHTLVTEARGPWPHTCLRRGRTSFQTLLALCCAVLCCAVLWGTGVQYLVLQGIWHVLSTRFTCEDHSLITEPEVPVLWRPPWHGGLECCAMLCCAVLCCAALCYGDRHGKGALVGKKVKSED